MEEDKDRLNNLRERLNEVHTWPSIYMFKFVLPNDDERVQQLRGIFGESAEFKTRLSAKGNYISLTVRAMMLDADSIFDAYRSASSVKEVIAL